MKHLIKSTAAGAALIAVSAVQAQAADIDQTAAFTGAILDTCAVTIPTPGLLGASADATQLSSKLTGGQSAVASVVTNNPRSTIQVLAPNAFTLAPAGSDTDTTFEADYTLEGNLIEGPVATLLGIGVNTVDVDATATKSSGAYEGGAYTMTVTVRCVTE